MAQTITVAYAGKPSSSPSVFPLALSVGTEDTVSAVKKAIATQYPKLSPTRQKITLKSDKKALSDDLVLSKAGFSTPVELAVKDLGPQISWKTVFLVEYAGPLVFHPLFYHASGLIYGQEVFHSQLQKYAYALILLHFVKREFETLFVHRFSHATMPLLNLFKNSGHYHLLSGVLLAGDLYRSAYSASSSSIQGTIRDNPTFLNVCAAIFVWAELSNLSTHLTLRNLRPAGTTKRAIPYGYGWSSPFRVSCPNYLFESIAWGTIACMTFSPAALLFFVVATTQMALWAVKKHSAYKKEFGKEYPRRKAMIPFIF